MFVPLASVIATLYLLLAGVQVLAEPLAVRTDKDGEGLKPICKGLKTKDQGCIRCRPDFSFSVVLHEVDFTAYNRNFEFQMSEDLMLPVSSQKFPSTFLK